MKEKKTMPILKLSEIWVNCGILYTTKFHIRKLYFLHVKWVYKFCVDLSVSNDYFLIPNSMIGFYNIDRVCLLRGTEYGFKCMCNSVFFVPYGR